MNGLILSALEGLDLFLRLKASLYAWPNLFQWGVIALFGIVSGGLIWFLARAGGLVSPRYYQGNLWLRALRIVFIPALGEEILFRALLVPYWKHTNHQWGWIAVNTFLFVLWHVFEGLTFLKALRAILLNPFFLAATAVLGSINAYFLCYTGSVWPGVFFHAAVVFVWQTWLGGPDLGKDLRVKAV
jgi:uncharacterized protein